MTVDCLIAVKWPFFYENKVHTKSLVAVAVVWGITIAHVIVMITLFNVLDPGTTRYLRKVIFPDVVLAGFITLFISDSFVFVANIIVEPSDKSKNKEREFWKKEFRLVRISIGLTLCFFLFSINALILNIKKLVYIDEKEPPIRYDHFLASSDLVQFYYVCNPIWYVALSYDVKREVQQLFRGKQVDKKRSFLPRPLFKLLE